MNISMDMVKIFEIVNMTTKTSLFLASPTLNVTKTDRMYDANKLNL